MKAAVYVRVSSEEQALKGHSLQAQEEICVNHVKDRGFAIHDVYNDDGYTAKNMKRPALKRMLEDVQNKKFDIIVIWRLDRLTRTTKDGLIMVYDLFEKNGITFHSITEDIDTTTSDGRMMLSIRLAMAQAERERIGERTTIGYVKRASEGRRNSPARPYGYQIGPDITLNVDEEEKAIVQMIYDWYLKGTGISKIVRDLNSRNIPANRGGAWNYISVKNILTSPTYIGYNHWKPKGAARIIEKGSHEPLVTEEQYKLIQNMRTQKANGEMAKSSYDYYYTTILKCGICGRPFYGKVWMRGDQRAKRYKCSGKSKHGDCSASEISEYRVTELVFEYLRFISGSDYDVKQKVEAPKGQDVEKERKRIERDLQKCRDVMKRLVDLLSSGRIDDEVYDDKRLEQTLKMDELKSQLDELPAEQMPSSVSREQLIEMIKGIREDWPYMEEMERKMFMQRFFNRIEILKVNGVWKVRNVDSM